MLIEDAGNPRHYLASMSVMILGDFSAQRIRTIVELIYYVCLSAIPVYAAIRYWRYPWRSRLTIIYLLLGSGAYGLAGFASASRHIGEWYAAFGAAIHHIVAGGQLLLPPGWDDYMLNFYLADWLVEESLELLAAAALAAAVLAYLREYLERPGIAD